MTDLFQALLLIPAGVILWRMLDVAIGIRFLSKPWRAPERRERRGRT
jgi:hypothetical protein